MSWHCYVFPCALEDHCKIGFSHDPLSRIQQLHPRWFEFFDLDAGAIIETDREREARDLELRLRSPLRDHRAPTPMSIQSAAGGFTEWVRGASAALGLQLDTLRAEGFIVHAPLRDWLRDALSQRADRLYSIQQVLQTHDPLREDVMAWRRFQDQVDACAALDVGWGSVAHP